jgi:hypothetical protein
LSTNAASVEGLAASGWPGDQNDSGAQFGGVGKLHGQVQRFEAGNLSGDNSHDDGARAALRENVDAKARNLRQTIGNIAGALLLQFVYRERIPANEIGGDASRIF